MVYATVSLATRPHGDAGHLDRREHVHRGTLLRLSLAARPAPSAIFLSAGVAQIPDYVPRVGEGTARAKELSVRAKFSLPRLRGLAITAALGLIVGGAGAAAAATSASPPHAVASPATPSAPAHHAVLDAEFVIGPIASFPTEEACVIFGESEFPPGSFFEGYVVVGSFCELGPALPPQIGSAWNVFLLVENPTCPPSHPAAGAPAVKPGVKAC